MTRSVSPSFKITVSAPGDYPTWRAAGTTKDTLFSIDNTANLSDLSLNGPSNESPPFNGIINAWSSFASDDAVIYSSLGGGHQTGASDAEWQNAVLKIDLMQPSPAWVIVDPGSAYDDRYITRRYLDGRPCSRHHYYDIEHIRGEFVHDGKARIFHPEAFATWATTPQEGWPGYGIDTSYGGGPDVEAFCIADAATGPDAWDAIGDWAGFPGFLGGDPPSDVQDKRYGLVYVARGHECWVFDASVAPHGTWTTITPSGMDDWAFTASAIDPIHEQLVGLMPSLRADDYTPRLERMSLSPPYTITTTELSNYTPQFGTHWEFYDAAMVYDPDNDRFLVVRPNADSNSSVDPPLLAIAQDGACTELTNAVIPKCVGTNGPVKRLVYVPTLHCVIYASRFTNDLHFIPTVTG